MNIIKKLDFWNSFYFKSIKWKINIAIFALMINVILIIMTGLFSVDFLSSIRALVDGNRIWSRHKNQLMYHLERFVLEQKMDDYYKYDLARKVLHSYQNVQAQLMSKVPDTEKIKQYLFHGKIHIDDIEGVTRLLVTFRRSPQVKRSQTAWEEALAMVDEIHNFAIKVKKEKWVNIQKKFVTLEYYKNKFQRKELQFNQELADAAKIVSKLILVIFLLLSSLFSMIFGILAIKIEKQIFLKIESMLLAVKQIAKGNFKIKIKLNDRSMDELDQLGNTFNLMSESLKKLDEIKKQSYQNSKLASIGELAAGIGHEINNPLTIANGYVFELKKKLKDNNKLDNESLLFFEKYKMASERIANIVNGLRTFSSPTKDCLEPFCLNECIQQIYDMISRPYLEEGISIENKLFNHELFAQGDIGRLQQALMNLITNAKDAVSEVSDPQIIIKLEKIDSKAIISIFDNGSEIKDEIKNKIYENFFSTKPIGKGSGIGLALTALIVQEHQGIISLESGKGKGTTFSITLPLIKSPPSIHKKRKEEYRNDNLFDSAKVLIVDDENEVGNILCNMIAQLGGLVEQVSSGEEAISKIEHSHFDYIFTDMKMKKINGVNLIAMIRRMNHTKQTKCFLMTGGILNGHDKISCIDGYLFKPFSVEKIFDLVNSSKK